MTGPSFARRGTAQSRPTTLRALAIFLPADLRSSGAYSQVYDNPSCDGQSEPNPGTQARKPSLVISVVNSHAPRVSRQKVKACIGFLSWERPRALGREEPPVRKTSRKEAGNIARERTASCRMTPVANLGVSSAYAFSKGAAPTSQP